MQLSECIIPIKQVILLPENMLCHLEMQSYIRKSCCIAVIIYHGELKVSASHLSLCIFFEIMYCGLILALYFISSLLVAQVNSL